MSLVGGGDNILTEMSRFSQDNVCDKSSKKSIKYSQKL